MNVLDIDTFWSSVAESRLIETSRLEQLRRSSKTQDTVAVAKWLVSQGVLSTWQARRLVRGDRGPFFVGNFRLMKRLDAEGSGLLFRVREEGTGKWFQLRLLERSLCKNQEIWSGIVRQTKIAKAVQSPLLSKTFTVSNVRSQRFIVCEDIPLTTLAEELSLHGKFTPESCLKVALEVTKGVAEIHRHGGVHGAISLHALRQASQEDGAASREAGIRLAQFPLAGDPHLQPPRLPLEQKEQIDALGHRACFLAPELTDSSSCCTPQSDVYAIGCLVHSLILGSAIGWKGSPRGTLANRVKVDMPPLAVSSDFAALLEVVAKMTARDPSRRYPTAVEAADALSTCIGRSTESLEPRPESISKDSSSDKVDMPSNGLQRLGGYRFLQPLGSGAMANVYLAEQESLSRHVAVKVLRPETVARGGAVERFTREARAAAALIHGNIVQIHEVGCIDDVHFIVQEYVAGPSLRSWLEHRGPLNAMQALTVLGDVGSALTRAAQQGVVHRDIKPENLLLTREGEVKVADFGLARIHEQDLSLTQDGTTLGTPLYMSPEQAEGREVDTRSDLYSLGATVYHLLSGRPPFGGATLIAVAMSHIRDELVPIESLRPDLPEALTSMLGKLLSKQVNQRYQNASELVQDVETVAMAVAGGSRRGDSPLAWDGDLDQWASGGGEAATTEMRSLQAPKHSDQRSGIANEPSPIVPLIDTSSEKKPGQKKPDRKRGRGRRAKQKQSSNRIGLWTTAGLLGVAGVGLIALVLVLFQTKTTSNEGDSKQPEQQGISNLDNLTSSKGSKSLPKNVDTTSQSDQSNVNRDQPVPTTVRRSRAELVDSDSLPWGSPTSGKPPSLAYLPLGAQLILLVRPADLVESEEGELFLKALGPFVSQSLGMLEKVSGNSLDQIETVQAGWRADDNGSAVGGYAIWLKDSANEKKIINAFGGMTSKKEGSETVYSSSQLSIWLPSLEKGRLVVCGAPSEVESILKTSAGIGPVGDSSEIQAILTRDMEQLVGMLDRTRHISLFGSPQYLRSEGRDVLTGSLANLVDPLKVFFSDAVRSAALSLHVGDKMYVELDVMSSVDERASVMAKNIMKKIGALATDVEDWTAGLVGLQYGRKIVNRLPGMIRILAASTRAGAEGKGVVVNAYLPEHAGHNIALAAELALAQAGGTSPSVMVSAQSGGGSSKPLSAQEKLQQKTSLSFPRDTLEKSIQLIAEDINLTIEILGNDLKLEGITKNQSFGLDEKEKTADEIIRAILIKANPDGKLVYIFRGQGENESLVITTRASAGERGDTIPPVFSSPTK